MMIKYDKLVRDGIPGIIEESGGSCATRKCSEDEIMEYLAAKLEEEVREFREKRSPEEVADILEVCRAIIREMGTTRERVEETRKRKLRARGGFRGRTILIEASGPASRPPRGDSENPLRGQ